MKIIHVPFCFYPDPVGGTEVYVDALARRQQERGMEVLVAAPAEHAASYAHDGLRVRRFPLASQVTDPIELYDEGNTAAALAFGQIVDEERPDVVHLHALTRGVSLRLVRATKQRRVPVVFTYHTPTVSCQRGTLLRWGQEICDGRLDLDLCTRCTLHGLGLPRAVAGVVGRMPVAVGRTIAAPHLSGGVWTALRMRALVQTRHAAVRVLLSEVDHVVAVAEWVRVLLVLNGVPAEKITVSRQGLCDDDGGGAHNDGAPRPSVSPSAPLRLAFVGRLHPTKGAHVLIQALRMAPELPVTLSLYGVAQGQAGTAYERQLQAMASGDQRIVFFPPLPAGQVVHRLRAYDLLAVPSQWMESGPMVVLEAFAAGTPALGSKLGGIAEIVEHGITGVLLEPPSSPEVWRRALQDLCLDGAILDRLRAGIRPPRTMATVAEEMAALYRSLLSERSAV